MPWTVNVNTIMCVDKGRKGEPAWQPLGCRRRGEKKQDNKEREHQ